MKNDELREIQVHARVKYNNRFYEYIGVIDDTDDGRKIVNVFKDKLPPGFTEEFGYHGLNYTYDRDCFVRSEAEDYAWELTSVIDLDHLYS